MGRVNGNGNGRHHDYGDHRSSVESVSKPADQSATSEYDRLPPHSIESEMSLLASVMVYDGPRDERKLMIAKLRAMVSPDSFFLADHGIIWNTLLTMHDGGMSIDALTLREQLIKQQMLNEVGGIAYLAQILQAVPSWHHWETYANRVAETYRIRQLISAANDTLRSCYAPSSAIDSSDAIKAKLTKQLVDLDRQGRFSTIVTIGQAARERLCRWGATTGGDVIYSGLEAWDKAIGGMERGLIYTVAGRPGAGKSQFAKQIAKNVSGGINIAHPEGAGTIDQPPIAVGLISIEEKRSKIADNMLSNASGVDNYRIRKQVASSEEYAEIEAASDRLDDCLLYIEDSAFTLTSIVATATRMVLEQKCAVLIIDHMHIVDAEMPGKDFEKITEISRAIKRLTKDLNTVTVLVAQLNRANEQAGTGKKRIRRPALSDLRGSGSIEQDSDVVALLHRDDYYRYKEPGYRPNHKLCCDIAKNKDGSQADLVFYFSGRTQSISNWIEPEEQSSVDAAAAGQGVDTRNTTKVKEEIESAMLDELFNSSTK